MKLLLTSNGLTTPPIRQEFLRLVAKPINEITIAFILTAADPEPAEGLFQKVIDGVKYWGDMAVKEASLQESKKVNVNDIKKFAPQELLSVLEKYDVIWVNGGNTFYLLHWAKKSGFMKVIHQLLEKGKVYVGSSAGTILAGPTIEVAGWKGVDDPNIVELENLIALKLVDFHIFPHFAPFWKKIVEQETAKLKESFYILSNAQAISVEGKAVKLIDG